MTEQQVKDYARLIFLEMKEDKLKRKGSNEAQSIENSSM